MNFTEVSEEILFTQDAITDVDAEDIEFLKHKATQNQRQRVRLCTHRDIDEAVHEMLIVHAKGIYVRPHKHLDKSESFHIIEGTLDALVFDDLGAVLEVTQMGDYSTGATFFHRVSPAYFHTVVPTSDLVVFHETIQGPFRPENNFFAPWAPSENDAEAQSRYFAALAEQLASIDRERTLKSDSDRNIGRIHDTEETRNG